MILRILRLEREMLERWRLGKGGGLTLYYHGRGAQTDGKRPQARSPLRHVAQIPVVDPYWLKTGLHVSM